MLRFNVRRLALLALFLVARFACTGRPTVFAVRKPVRAIWRWWQVGQQGTARCIDHVRRQVADRLIRFAERLSPPPQATPLAMAEGPALMDWTDAQPPHAARTPVPSTTPSPADVQERPEPAKKSFRGQQRPKSKHQTMASASRATRKATQKRQPNDDRAAKYEVAARLVAAGKPVNAAAREAGLPPSSLRTWLKKRRSAATGVE